MSDLTGKMMKQEYRLWVASQSYLTGEITVEKLEEIESSYTEDFNSAMVVLAKRNVQRKFIDIIRGLFLFKNKRHDNE